MAMRNIKLVTIEDVSSINDPETLARLAKSEDFGLRKAVAASRHAPAKTLEQLAADGVADVRQIVAGNPHTTSSTLDVLAADRSDLVRESVACNPHTHYTSLADLAVAQNREIRQAVSRNPNTHPSTLAKLASDQDAVVRRFVSSNENTPSEDLSLLAKDGDGDVRKIVATKRWNTAAWQADAKPTDELEHPPVGTGMTADQHSKLELVVCQVLTEDIRVDPDHWARWIISQRPTSWLAEYLDMDNMRPENVAAIIAAIGFDPRDPSVEISSDAPPPSIKP